MGDDALRSVREALGRVEQADRDLRDAVRRARAGGVTWAALGTTLGTTRQAAFKRFGTPRDPRTGETMTGTPTDELAALGERVFALVDAGDHATLASLMTPATAEVLTRDVVLDTWASAVAATGNLVRCVGTTVATADGTPATEVERVLGEAIVDTTLECEAGEWRGRVALDADRRMIGLLVVAPDATDLPW